MSSQSRFERHGTGALPTVADVYWRGILPSQVIRAGSPRFRERAAPWSQAVFLSGAMSIPSVGPPQGRAVPPISPPLRDNEIGSPTRRLRRLLTQSLPRTSNDRWRPPVIETLEVHMDYAFDIYADIAELRAELAECILTRKERVETQARLDQLLAEADRRRETEEA